MRKNIVQGFPSAYIDRLLLDIIPDLQLCPVCNDEQIFHPFLGRADVRERHCV